MRDRLKSKLFALVIITAIVAVSAVISYSSSGEDMMNNDISIPPIDLAPPETTETAAFALG